MGASSFVPYSRPTPAVGWRLCAVAEGFPLEFFACATEPQILRLRALRFAQNDTSLKDSVQRFRGFLARFAMTRTGWEVACG